MADEAPVKLIHIGPKGGEKKDGFNLVTERVVALGGPMVRQPRLLCTRLGADLTDLKQTYNCLQARNCCVNESSSARYSSPCSFV